MDHLQWTWMLASHAVQVSLLVGMVWCVTKLLGKKRPHLAHSLWILVLIKCLMPPTWSSPTSVFSWLGSTISYVSSAAFGTAGRIQNQSAATINKTAEADGSNRFRVSYGSIEYLGDTNTSHKASSEPILRHQENAALTWAWISYSILIVLGVGFVTGILITVVRLKLFLSSAYASGFRQDDAIDAEVKRLCQRLKIKQKVTVHVIGDPIGPVVLGLFRPTLLLPELIVAGRNPRELDPLIAHELIHIRRGDLWWALLQTLATCLWWFHPLVHYASRMATREAESSCDEETIMSLGCSPSTYARSLLDILERKNQLHIAPALPGVRPVDVTLNRMERIMNLGHGSHQRAPRWIWGLFLFVCALVLPSAAWSVAQDGSGNEAEKPAPAVESSPQEPMPVADAFQNAQWDIGDLIDMLKSNGYEEQDAKELLLKQLPARNKQDLESYFSKLGLSSKATVDFPEPVINDRELHVVELKSQIDEISIALAKLRSTGFKQITCEVSVISMAPEDFIETSKQWSSLQLVFALDASEIQSRAKLWDHIDVQQASTISKTGHGVRLAYAKMDSLTKSSATKLGGHSNLSDLKTTKLSALDVQALLSQPTSNCLRAPKLVALSGQSASVATRVQHANFGESKVDMWEEQKIDFLPVINATGSIDLAFEFEIIHTPVHEAVKSKNPPKESFQIAIKDEVLSGQTFVVGGVATQVDGKDRILLICLTPSSGGINTKVNVKYEPLLKGKGPGEYHQLKMLGPVTSASSSIDYFSPSEDEVIWAIEKKRTELCEQPQIANGRKQIPSISLRKISKKVEPAKFVPLIGNAELHHTIYECTIETEPDSGLLEVVYIDHNHFHMVD